MAKGAYVGINGVARKIKGGYVGVSDTAQKIKKAYVGVGGVARPCWGDDGKLKYYGPITALSESLISVATTSVGDYLLFAGGMRYTAIFNGTTVVDAYSSKLVHSSATPLSQARFGASSTAVGNYALFGGGGTSLYGHSAVVDAYSSSLVRSSVSSLSFGRSSIAAITVGGYALFGGGNYSSGTYQKTVDVYSSTLVRSAAADLSEVGFYARAANAGNYALFAPSAKNMSTLLSNVDAYSTTLVKSVATPLSLARVPRTASAGTYAVFAGGQVKSTNYEDDSYANSPVDTYSANLTRGLASDLSTAMGAPAISAKNHGVFMFSDGAAPDAYNFSLVKERLQPFSMRYPTSAGSVGDFIIVVGSTTDVYDAPATEAYIY